jgi:hypothetical protein
MEAFIFGEVWRKDHDHRLGGGLHGLQPYRQQDSNE